MSTNVKETVLQFGPGRRLLGLLSLPAAPDPQRPAIVIANTGFEHRAGPHRLHVHLCRALAEAGFAALRLDLSGLGDSGMPDDGTPPDPVTDLRLAMDELERRGIAHQCIPIGLCSGGHDAHRYAIADSRVVAAAFLDHYLYHTPRSWSLALKQRLSEPRRFVNLLRRLSRTEALLEQQIWYEQPDRRRFREDLGAFMARRMPLFFLFTGEYQNIYNYPDQLLDVCPELGDYPLHELHYFPESDHTFSQSAMRARLLSTLRLWLLEQVLPQLALQVQIVPAASASAATSVSPTPQNDPLPSVPPTRAAASHAFRVNGLTAKP